MINHIRTLLLNLDGGGFARGPGEEYAPPSYRAAALPGDLAAVRAALFGRSPDRRTLLYRLRQFLACLHATELSEYVTAADPRLTYLPLATGGFELAPGTAAAAAGGHAFPLYVGGSAPAGGDRTDLSWSVAVTP